MQRNYRRHAPQQTDDAQRYLPELLMSRTWTCVSISAGAMIQLRLHLFWLEHELRVGKWRPWINMCNSIGDLQLPGGGYAGGAGKCNTGSLIPCKKSVEKCS